MWWCPTSEGNAFSTSYLGLSPGHNGIVEVDGSIPSGSTKHHLSHQNSFTPPNRLPCSAKAVQLNRPLIEKVSGPEKQAYPLKWVKEAALMAELPPHLRQMALFDLNTDLRESALVQLRFQALLYIPVSGSPSLGGRRSSHRSEVPARRSQSAPYFWPPIAGGRRLRISSGTPQGGPRPALGTRYPAVDRRGGGHPNPRSGTVLRVIPGGAKLRQKGGKLWRLQRYRLLQR